MSITQRTKPFLTMFVHEVHGQDASYRPLHKFNSHGGNESALPATLPTQCLLEGTVVSVDACSARYSIALFEDPLL
jgi:hypothetical protein